MRAVSAFASPATLPASRTSLTRTVCTQRAPRMAAVEAAVHTLNGRSITGPLQPLANNVLVKVAEAAEETAGGLILSSGAKEKPTHGLAIAVGEGKFLGSGVMMPMSIQSGDTVLYGKYGGTDIEYDGDKHTFVTQDDILCILEKGEYAAEAVRPLFDRVLVKRDAALEETESGIVLGKASEKPTSGRVIAVGPGRFMENGQTEPLSFEVGDVVMYGKYSGTEVTFRGEEYMLLRIADVFAKWE